MKLKIMALLLLATLSAYALNKKDAFVMSITRPQDYELRDHIHAIERNTRPAKSIIAWLKALANYKKDSCRVFDNVKIIEIDACILKEEMLVEYILDHVPCIIYITGLKNQKDEKYTIFKNRILKKVGDDRIINEYRSEL